MLYHVSVRLYSILHMTYQESSFFKKYSIIFKI